MNPVRHVVVALGLTAILFVLAGDSWNERVAKVQPVRVADRKV